MDCDSNRGLIAYYRSRLYETVNDPSKASIVAWSESGKSFIVGDEVEFRKAVLPRECLVHLGFSQSHEQCEYACPYFMRGQPDLKPSSQDKLIRKIETNNKVHDFIFRFVFAQFFFVLSIVLNMVCFLIRA